MASADRPQRELLPTALTPFWRRCKNVIMIRTQIQLPDALYREVKRVAAEREMSLAELVRRGLETVLSRFPAHPESRTTWELPKPQPLGGDAFFEDPDWRYDLNQGRGVVREKTANYRARRKGGRT